MLGLAALAAFATGAGPSAEYLAAIESYRRGDRRAAVAVAWTEQRVKEELARLRRIQGVPAGATAFPYEPAVMFHTDRYFAARESAAAGATFDLDVAQEILALIPGTQRRAAVERRWFLAVGHYFHWRMDWDAALRVFEEGLRRQRDDPQLLLARGAVLEIVVLLAAQQVDAARLMSPRASIRGAAQATMLDAWSRLTSAETAYRRALAADPTLTEARLRLGRVLQRLGRFERSLPELQAVLESTGVDPRIGYLAQLFIGAAHEAAGRMPEAIAAYEGAVRLVPEGQAAYIALSHALRATGDWRRAQDVLDAGLARAGKRRQPDAWWEYPWGRSGDAERLLEELRQDASR